MKYNKIDNSKIEEFISKNEKLCVIVMMLFSALFLAYPFFDVYPLHTTTDEMGAIVGAASWAGYDWSGVIDRSGYYGFGYYSLFAPLFMLKLSPIAIYRTILIVTRVIRAVVIFGVTYYIGRYYFKFSSKSLLMLISFICTLPFFADMDGTIVNDIIIEAVLWLVMLMQCKVIEYIDKPRKCIFYGCIYVGVCVYTMLLHTRAVVVVIASFITMLGVLVFKKKKALLTIFLMIPVAYIVQQLIGIYQNQIWISAGGELTNASVSVASNLNLLDINTWIIWLDILIGNITVQMLLTGGLFLGAIVAVIRYIYILVVEKKSESIYVNTILTTSIMCIGAIILGLFVSNWFSVMYATWEIDPGEYAYAYKGLCYVRYWNVFAMPFMFTGLYLLQKCEAEKWIRAFICVAASLIFAFIRVVVPLLDLNKAVSMFLYKFLTSINEERNQAFYYKCIIIFIIVLMASVIMYRLKKNYVYVLAPIVLMMMIGYNNSNAYYNAKINDSISNMVLASYEQKCLLEDNSVEIGRVYAIDNRKADSNWYIFSVLQFYFYEYRIEDDYPMYLESNDVIITTRRNSEIEKTYPTLHCYMLDDNEVWYTELDLVGIEPLY